MSKYKVYLAGPILGLSPKDATDWRKSASESLNELGLEALSPMRHKEYLGGYDTLPDVAEKFVMSSQKGIVARDRNDVMRCDAVLMYLVGAKRVSIGTMVELGWADAFRKPIIVVVTEEDLHWHAFVREISGFVVKTLGEGIDAVFEVLT